MPLDIEILFEDDHCLVLNKPSGLATQAPRGIDSLEVRVRAHLQSIVNADLAYWQCDPTGQGRMSISVFPIVSIGQSRASSYWPKRKKAPRKISRQFERRLVEKKYWALVEGYVDSRRRHLDRSLAQNPRRSEGRDRTARSS